MGAPLGCCGGHRGRRGEESEHGGMSKYGVVGGSECATKAGEWVGGGGKERGLEEGGERLGVGGAWTGGGGAVGRLRGWAVVKGADTATGGVAAFGVRQMEYGENRAGLISDVTLKLVTQGL
ncbi:hypothetical protein Tco_0151882 [Tanacetum coccineum]